MEHAPSHEFLRHALATLAYRGAKTLRDAPESFAAFRVAEGTRTPARILAHIGDLFDWALAMADGRMEWHDSEPLAWPDEVARFFRTLAAFDVRLATGVPLGMSVEKLFQGPVADAFTHFGQIAMLRRMAGAPVRGESYFMARIAIGQVGPDQPPPRREFD
jgi:hypothetical protein